MITALLGGLVVLAFGVGVLGLVVAAIAVEDWWVARGGWASDEGEGSAVASAPPSPSSDASDLGGLCTGCGRLHESEALPLELLVAGGVEVSPSRWFGGRRPA